MLATCTTLFNGAGELLVTKDNVSYFLGSDGKPCRKTTITWSAAPHKLLATPLYVVGLLPSAVEVKSISRIAAAAAEQVRAGRGDVSSSLGTGLAGRIAGSSKQLKGF